MSRLSVDRDGRWSKATEVSVGGIVRKLECKFVKAPAVGLVQDRRANQLVGTEPCGALLLRMPFVRSMGGLGDRRILIEVPAEFCQLGNVE